MTTAGTRTRIRLVIWAATGNRTRIFGTTNRRNNRYTIAAMAAARRSRAAKLYLFLGEKSRRFRYTGTMDDEGRKLAILILFVLGAAVGFYLAGFFF